MIEHIAINHVFDAIISSDTRDDAIEDDVRKIVRLDQHCQGSRV